MELNKRYNFNRPLKKEEVDHNWDEIIAGFQSIGQLFPDGVIVQPVVTWSGVGLKYYGSRALVKEQGVFFPIPFKELTLAAGHATHGRIDTIVVNNSTFEYVIKPGTPSANPEPPVIDPLNEVFVRNILVPANATEPTGITNTIVFDEGAPEEWTPTFESDSGQATCDFEDTTSPFAGAIVAKVVVNVPDAVFLKFDADIDFNGDDFDAFGFFLNQTAPMAPDASYVFFLDETGTILKMIKPSFNPNLINQWQLLSINGNEFADVVNARSVMIAFKVDPANSFFIDRVYLQGGITNPPSALQHDDIAGIKGNGTFHLSETERNWLYPTLFEGVEIPLSNPVRGAYKEATSTAAIYTIAETPAPVTGGWAKFKINVSQATLDAATLDQPEITGATKIAGSEFVVDTDMYILVEKTISGAVEYWFAEIAEA